MRRTGRLAALDACDEIIPHRRASIQMVARVVARIRTSATAASTLYSLEYSTRSNRHCCLTREVSSACFGKVGVNNMAPQDETELFWQAFRYVGEEMTPGEATDFEVQLADDQATREAVARVVELSQVVLAAASRAVAGRRFVSPASQSSRLNQAWMQPVGWISVELQPAWPWSWRINRSSLQPARRRWLLSRRVQPATWRWHGPLLGPIYQARRTKS